MMKKYGNNLDLSIIIISFNTKDLLKNCIESIKANTKKIKYEMIIVDNASIDSSSTMLRKLFKSDSDIKLIQNSKNLGFARANNQAMKISKGKYMLLLNSDTLVNSNVLEDIIKWMDEHKKVGISTCSLVNPNGTTQGTGGYFPTLIRTFSWMTIQDIPFVDKLIKPFHPLRQKSIVKGEGFYKKSRELDWVTGAFFLMRRKVYKQVGLFDTNFFYVHRRC